MRRRERRDTPGATAREGPLGPLSLREGVVVAVFLGVVIHDTPAIPSPIRDCVSGGDVVVFAAARHLRPQSLVP
jgi:hypothetical protein